MIASEDDLGSKDDPDENWEKRAASRLENLPKQSLGVKLSNGEEGDIYKLLAAKDRDLILAAELGKALLEKNEELSRRNEKIAEDFSIRLEVLEQEKYQLKRQLEVAEEEYSLRLGELQADILSLREALQGHSSIQKLYEKERSQTVEDLSEQNQRLTEDLRVAADTETQLRQTIKRMRSQFSARRSSMQEQFIQMEHLREEIDSVLSKKEDLERQIQMLLEEREGLSGSLDLNSKSILELQRKHREQEAAIRLGEREAEDLRTINHHLVDKLETISRSRSSSPFRMSLQSEMELSVSGSDSEKSMRRQFDVIDEMDEYELDEHSHDDNDDDDDDDDDDEHMKGNEAHELHEEAVSVYTQLINMDKLIRERRRKRRPDHFDDSMDTASSGSTEYRASRLEPGQLADIVQQIIVLIRDLIRREGKCDGGAGCTTRLHKLELEKKLHSTTEEFDRGSKALRKAELTAKVQEEELRDLRSKLTLLRTRLEAAEEERSVLKSDLENLSSTRDETIKRAWQTRDSAVDRKNSAEVELARARIDVMQANSELLSAVQQKVSISEQLDDWQADIHTVIGQRITESESENLDSAGFEKSGKSDLQRKISKPNSKLMSFFQRT